MSNERAATHAPKTELPTMTQKHVDAFRRCSTYSNDVNEVREVVANIQAQVSGEAKLVPTATHRADCPNAAAPTPHSDSPTRPECKCRRVEGMHESWCYYFDGNDPHWTELEAATPHSDSLDLDSRIGGGLDVVLKAWRDHYGDSIVDDPTSLIGATFAHIARLRSENARMAEVLEAVAAWSQSPRVLPDLKKSAADMELLGIYEAYRARASRTQSTDANPEKK